MAKRFYRYLPVSIVLILLAIMPFFWLSPGEVDIGGDGGRLYFYDPVNLIKNVGSFYVSPSGTGETEASFFYLPFIASLIGFNEIFGSSYILVSFFNAVKIVVSFVAIYLIIKELIGNSSENRMLTEISAILAGLFYIFTPAMTNNYLLALLSHNQIFLNPLIFYLVLRFIVKDDLKYIWIALLVSLIFANNFSFSAAPPFFAFYPLAFVFILAYTFFIRQAKIPWRKFPLVLLFFLGLHAFHLLPEAYDLLTPGSHTNTRVFDAGDIKDQIGYFYGVLAIPKISSHFLAYSPTNQIEGGTVIFAAVFILGLYFNKKKNKTILLAGLFFLIALFFVTAKIADIGIKFYEVLFYIPGFSMFRNFFGQWQFVFYFFYALFFGLAVSSLLNKIRSYRVSIIIFGAIVFYLILSSWKFIDGGLVNPIQNETKDTRTAITMDPDYEKTLEFIRSLPVDGKILILPFTDTYEQIFYGLNSGAYVGTSTIGQLTGKKDFSGYARMASYGDVFWKISERKDYESIKELLGILNIRYVFHNTDPRIYDSSSFPRRYSPDFTRKYMPHDQKAYKGFIENFTTKKIYERGFFSVYQTEEATYLPHFYTAKTVEWYEDDPKLSGYSKASSFFPRKEDADVRVAYIDKKNCQSIYLQEYCDENNPDMYVPRIFFERINQTKYKISVFDSKKPYLLVFSEAFHENWKVFMTEGNPEEKEVIASHFEGEIKEGKHTNVFLNTKIFETFSMKPLSEDKHFQTNAYANAWYIEPSDVSKRSNYELIVEMTGQRIFYIGLFISAVTLLTAFIVAIFFKKFI